MGLSTVPNWIVYCEPPTKAVPVPSRTKVTVESLVGVAGTKPPSMFWAPLGEDAIIVLGRVKADDPNVMVMLPVFGKLSPPARVNVTE